MSARDRSAREVIVDGSAWEAYRDRDYQVIGGYSTLPERLAEELGGGLECQRPRSLDGACFVLRLCAAPVRGSGARP